MTALKSVTALATAAMLTELRGEVVMASQGSPAPTEHADRLARDLHLLPALCDDMLAAITSFIDRQLAD